jgi:hypothetical protein
VRKKGLEPPRREAPDPKSGAATNYATSAFFLNLVSFDLGLQRYNLPLLLQTVFEKKLFLFSKTALLSGQDLLRRS